jgi:hypothetical protein
MHMQKLAALALAASLTCPVFAHEKPDPKPQPQATKQRSEIKTDLYVAGAAALLVGVVIYQNEKHKVEVKKAEDSTTPVLVYTRRF